MGKRPGTDAAEGFALLADALLRGRVHEADRLADSLVAGWTDDERVPRAASAALRTAVAAAWERGRQPADLVHARGRKMNAVDRRLLVRVVAAEALAWRHLASADPDWVQQLADLDASEVADPDGVVGEWTKVERLDRSDALERAATLLAALWTSPSIPPVGDPPSAWGHARRPAPPPSSRDNAGAIDDRVLTRVRALLAKAESTEFEPEAEALTAKAQELMARYAIDAALVAEGVGGGADHPGMRRVLIHDPYAKGKATLLNSVAVANRCEAVWSKEEGFCTVIGFPTDLAVTDVLFTSLVSQCSAAMQHASRHVRGARTFRDSFVLAFAVRIGARLREAADATVAEAAAERGASLLPVLAARHDRVEAARDEAFPRLRSTGVRSVDPRGWAAGEAAADVARLDSGRAVGR